MKIHAFGPNASYACGPREQHADASSYGLSCLAQQELDSRRMRVLCWPVSGANRRSSIQLAYLCAG